MAQRVEVGGWEQSCCGSEIVRGSTVRWTCIRTQDGQLYETHHDLEGLELATVEGRVEDIEAVDKEGSPIPIARIPSGDAMNGWDSQDDGRLERLDTHELFEWKTERFIVTLI
ncbi:DUF6578 domain-containing protein [Naasia aerilata]|uniref:Uncharacterized protein n=1 Tax=Naasia aerilata TaxID=1162966 RepID=A0ABN6XNL0_9MICO|nr:DUF6578 domain-containing protein [Naasia aerilata]BDZ46541.1 hypothetical protein GCM10025866_24500 [Naasia aerilata]